MGFTNPASSVTLAAGASVSITGKPTVDATGSTGLGVTSTVSGNIPATASASLKQTSSTGTAQLLANSTGTTRYILTSAVLAIPNSGTARIITLTLTGTASGTLCVLGNGSSGAAPSQQFDLNDLLLPVGAGVQMAWGGSSSTETDAIVYYATVDSTAPTVSGNIISGGAI